MCCISLHVIRAFFDNKSASIILLIYLNLFRPLLSFLFLGRFHLHSMTCAKSFLLLLFLYIFWLRIECSIKEQKVLMLRNISLLTCFQCIHSKRSALETTTKKLENGIEMILRREIIRFSVLLLLSLLAAKLKRSLHIA